MSHPPAPLGETLPPNMLAALRAELRSDESVVWTGRPLLRGFLTDLLLSYPICILGAAALAALGWLFHRWAGDAALEHPRFLLVLVLLALGAVPMIVVPPLWPLRLRQSWYALTNQRVIVHQPLLLFFWPTSRTIEASAARKMRVRATWAYLPDETGDLTCSGGDLERVPFAPAVADLIRRTLDEAGQATVRRLSTAVNLDAPDILRELSADERLVWVGRPSFRVFWQHYWWILTTLLVLAVLALVLGQLLWWPLTGLGLLLLGPVARIPIGLLGLRRTWYALTTRRVLVHRPMVWWFWGWRRTRGADAERVGELVVAGSELAWPRIAAGKPDVSLRWVEDAEAVADLIRETLAKGDGGRA